MEMLNLPTCDLNVRRNGIKKEIFDSIRKRFVVLTPEEWVRQHFIQFLLNELHVPASLIGVETSLKYNGLSKRSDIVVYDRIGKPAMAIECKASTVKIDQKVFDQLARYNMVLNVSYLVVTNGMVHYCCQINKLDGSYSFLQEIPPFEML
ncbi:type I restriction enzyme HsdR N-terminal domain-containing protein [Alistipes sp. ZOR0009]|uniref:type I restriction enzyme HsdR N-terminal domain-containing protein n=1 Tax=Alistipes sp. ZOR0009 TaxID=1339253 RepID=UPI0006454D28|nr:type I restriction enzyme HsdR N-terminal domain-containing protein [Alistipes sp. ZOR0009]